MSTWCPVFLAEVREVKERKGEDLTVLKATQRVSYKCTTFFLASVLHNPPRQSGEQTLLLTQTTTKSPIHPRCILRTDSLSVCKDTSAGRLYKRGRSLCLTVPWLSYSWTYPGSHLLLPPPIQPPSIKSRPFYLVLMVGLSC